MLRKILKIMKNNILGFVVGAIIFSGLGYVVAATIQSSNVTYTTNKDSSISNVKQAVDKLYEMGNKSDLLEHFIVNDVDHIATYKYWNSTSTYHYNEYPSNASDSAVASGYYIKTVIINGISSGHKVCYNQSGRYEICLKPNYWAGRLGVADNYAQHDTEIKLMADFMLAYDYDFGDVYLNGVLQCRHSGSSFVSCNVKNSSFSCYASYDGSVGCGSYNGTDSCIVQANGDAFCRR